MVKQTTEESQESAANVDEVGAGEIATDAASVQEKSDAGTPAEQTPEERFRATTKLIFLAPDVPPVPIRPRRSDLRRTDTSRQEPRRNEFHQLDELLDDHLSHDERSDDRHEERGDRSSSSKRTRRRGGSDEDDSAKRERRQAPVITEPQKVKGSTRLEAKKQRRRDGRDAGRRRSVITESEFLARRESVDREMIVRTTNDRVQIGVLEDKVLVEHYVARSSETSLIGNVYLGRVQNVLPSMEAAFVDIGRGRNAVLYSGEVDWSEFEGGNTARRIENALKPGDQVLVQVTKDPVGHKGARLTSQVSLPGRFLVYVPGGAMNGISRKLPDTERARLKKILKEVLPGGAGVIVRTAAEGATEEQLTRDVDRLTRQWESIQKRASQGGGPVMLHSEPDMLIKIVRDVFNEDFHRLVIQGESTYGVIEDYLQQVAPDLLSRVERYEGNGDIFDGKRVTEQIQKALDRKVWLPSGGSLVIDRTEAMTVIDVNTGKFVGSGGNLEETVTKNNLEAAEEIVRQLRLRDIGGIIVIDFIDMVLESNRDLVLRRLVECLSRDRTKHQVAEVTSLGLVQMTRKKLGLGLLESFSEACDTCAGRGLIVHHEPVSKQRHESGRSGKRNKNAHQQNQAGESKKQTHAITDGAKNMLAQVAASTLTPAKTEADDAGDRAVASGAASSDAASSGARSSDDASTGTSPSSAGSSKAGTSTREPAAKRSGRVSSRRESANEADPKDLLDSVLEALPEASRAGAGRTRSRRVSVPATSTASDAGSSSATDGSREAGSAATSGSHGSAEAASADVDPAEAAQRALAAALDETAKQRGRG